MISNELNEDEEKKLHYVSYQLYVTTILGLGFFGNIMGIVVLLKRKLVKLGARNTFRYLFITDTIYLIQMVVDSIAYNYGYDITAMSVLSCRVYFHVNNSIATLSPMLLVYISLERLISIKYPHKRFILRKPNNQFIYLICIFVFNMVYYSPFLFYFNFSIQKSSSNRSECNFADSKSIRTFSYMDLTNRVLMPCLLTTFTSILLILTIFKTRNRAFRHIIIDNRSFKKDAKFTITSICINLFYIVLTLPLPIYNIFSDYFSEFAFSFAFYLFCLTYSINFYIFLLFNSLFRKEFIVMFYAPHTMHNKRRNKTIIQV